MVVLVMVVVLVVVVVVQLDDGFTVVQQVLLRLQYSIRSMSASPKPMTVRLLTPPLPLLMLGVSQRLCGCRRWLYQEL